MRMFSKGQSVFVVRRDQNGHAYRVFSLRLFVPDLFSTLLIRLLREHVREVVLKLMWLVRQAVSFTFHFFLVSATFNSRFRRLLREDGLLA
jgi:hypothetical protein